LDALVYSQGADEGKNALVNKAIAHLEHTIFESSNKKYLELLQNSIVKKIANSEHKNRLFQEACKTKELIERTIDYIKITQVNDIECYSEIETTIVSQCCFDYDSFDNTNNGKINDLFVNPLLIVKEYKYEDIKNKLNENFTIIANEQDEKCKRCLFLLKTKEK
jgi:hypothetical protein